MKQTKKSFLFTNFKTNPQKLIQTNDLNILSSYNVSVKNNIIEPNKNFSTIFEKLFSFETFQFLKENFNNFLKSLVHIEVYEYVDTENNTNNRIFVLDNQFNLYEFSHSQKAFLPHNIKFQTFPKLLKCDNSLILSASGDKLVVIEQRNAPITITPSSNIDKFCSLNNTLYFTSEKNKFNVYYVPNSSILNISDELENYNSYSFDVENGEVLDVFVYDKKIYVIQQYQISKLETTSSSSSFVKSCKINCKIFKNSTCLFDDFVLFVSSAGIFKFDGNDIKFIFENISKSINLKDSISVAYNNKFYLKSNFTDADFNINTDVIFEFNLNDESYEIFSIGTILDLYTLKTTNNYYLIATIKDNDDYNMLCMDEDALSNYFKYVQTNKFMLSNPNLKIVKDMKLNSYGTFDIILKSDLETKFFTVNNSNKSLTPSLSGHIFQILIIGESKFLIESITLTTIENEDYYD